MKQSFDEELNNFKDELRIQSSHKEALKKQIIFANVEQLHSSKSRKNP